MWCFPAIAFQNKIVFNNVELLGINSLYTLGEYEKQNQTLKGTLSQWTLIIPGKVLP